MSTTNAPFQVLVTKNNQAILAAGNRVTSLAPGQIGVFNIHTGLSLNASSAAGQLKDIFIAVGVDKTGSSTLEDINTSAGQYIQTRNARFYTVKGHTLGKPKIVDITDFGAVCDSDYAIKIEFRNQETYRLFGTNALSKIFTTHTSPCTGTCEYCGDGDANEVVAQIITDINNDSDQLVKAEYLDYTTTPGSPVVIAPGDVAAWIADADNDGKKLGIRLSSQPAKAASSPSGNINLNYLGISGTDIIVSLPEGFLGNGKITVFQELAYPEGAGKDLIQLEYIAGGWNGKPGPYRQSTVTGLERGGYETYASTGTNYNVITLGYDIESVAGWQEHKNNLETIIAIPCADSTTLTGLVAVLDAALPQFAPMANDVASMDCTNVETSDLTEATDGIETLA